MSKTSISPAPAPVKPAPVRLRKKKPRPADPVPLDRLDSAPADAVRSGPRDPGRIAEYARAMRRRGPTLPPVKAFARRDGASRQAARYYLADGGYRLAAFRQADPDATHIDAEVIWCGSDAEAERGAWAAALKANEDHGVARSTDDKRAAVRAALARPELAELTARELAKLCRVSHTFVNSLKTESASPGRPRGGPPSGNVSTPDAPRNPDGSPAGIDAISDATAVSSDPFADAPGAEPRPLIDRPELWDYGEEDDADNEPASAPDAAIDLNAALDFRHPDHIHVDVPIGVTAVKGRDRFEVAMAALKSADKLVKACQQGPAGQHLRAHLLGRDQEQPGLAEMLYGLGWWYVALSDTRPDDEPCCWCGGVGRDDRGPCRPCAGAGFTSARSRELVNHINAAQRLPFKADDWEVKAPR